MAGGFIMNTLHCLRTFSSERTLRNSLPLVALLALLSACQSEKAEPTDSDTATSAQTANADTSTSTGTPSATTGIKPARQPSAVFWESLETLCDKSFQGQLTIGTEESDREFGLADMIMYSKRCKPDAIDIGFKVDEDDSRTWMFRKTDQGLSLHHRHVDDSGKEDATSGYGGVANTEGTTNRQEFPADDNTGTMIPAAATNVWAIEIEPGKAFAYELQRIEEQRMFRVVFDLTKPL